MLIFNSEQNGKLSKEITERCGIPFGKAMSYIRKKDVKVNGKRTGKDVEIAAGDEITVYADENAEQKPSAEKVFAPTELYKDDNVLALYKPKGVDSEEFFASVNEIYTSAGFVHRLDRNTDGVMLFSLNENAEEELKKGFKDRSFDKYYLAEVWGTPYPSEKTLVGYLVKDAEKKTVKVFGKRVKGSTEIKTEYKVLKSGRETSVLLVKLITGKTHQIRAHLAFSGHFVLGDGKYGKESVNRKFHLKKQRLTAYKLVFHFKNGRHLSYLEDKEIIYENAAKDYGVYELLSDKKIKF